ncbi:MAG: ATP-dependent zinc metalloprotease FtsH [Leptospiraceae bacterium]|nr:ATP-dependent zinc metalloprotease FtsH [Leptospiraceae bacterium]MDW8306343.1 ATP-dependent zinc metalloprotease FtsH [Leptospiraceae bacterium]
MNRSAKNIALILLIVVLSALMYQMVRGEQVRTEDIPYSQFLNKVEARKIMTTPSEPLVIQGSTITGKYRAENNELVAFRTYIPYSDPFLLEFLRKHRVSYFKGTPQEESIFWRSLLGILPWLLVLGFIWFMMVRQIQSTGNRAMTFGRARAKLNADMKNKVKFEDVAGVEEAKQELQEVVDFLKNPKKFQAMGAKIPKGVLLVGPPGTGKTLLARAVAGEAGVPFFSISGSDFVEMFVGVGASRVRDLFSQAKRNAPCIVFIDEIDAVGRLRGAGLGGGHDEREQTLNQLLVEMDGFEENEGVIVLAATNRPDVLDPALLRPGRFDRQVVVDVPDVTGREKILQIHARKVPLAPDADLAVVAKGTPGFTGADLANLINEAALLAARADRKKVTMQDLEEARDKVLMGPERKSFYISPEEKRVIAYHEAGHALLGELLEYAEPIHKVTIIPRGKALGLTQYLPEQEKHMRSKNFWLDEITVLLGGRLAEDLIFHDVTTGASNDIERATAIARKMVMEWGMSERIGPIRLSGHDAGAVFLGRDYVKPVDHSEEYARLVDEEVKKIIDSSLERGRSLLKKHMKALEAIAQALLEREVITGEELRQIIQGKSLPPKNPEGTATAQLPGEKKTRKRAEQTDKVTGLGGVQPAS